MNNIGEDETRLIGIGIAIMAISALLTGVAIGLSIGIAFF